jgi:parvulin-like peptidyl-prolyl isomerase
LSLVANRLRVSVLSLAAVVAIPLLSACSTSPGAAATVGGDRISTAHLQAEVTAALANPQAAQQVGSNRAAFARELLAKMISDDVVAGIAKARHVTVTSNEVAAQTQAFIRQAGSLKTLQAQAAQGGIPPSRLPAFIRAFTLQQQVEDSIIRTLPVTQAQLQQAYDANKDSYDQVHAAHILVKTKSLATRLLAQVKQDPSRFAALAAKYSIDTGSKDQGGDLGFTSRSKVVASFGTAIFTHPVGSFVIAHSKFGYHVIHIIAHRVQSLASVTPQLKAGIFASQRTALLGKAVVAESRRLGVHVSPRYGTWNAAKQAVIATKDPVSSAG